MKKRLLLVAVLALAGTGIFYQITGRFPWDAVPPEQQAVLLLRADFDTVREQWKAAGRATISGMDTSSITDSPLAKLEQTEKALADLTPRLKTPDAVAQANQLRQDISTFKRTMR